MLTSGQAVMVNHSLEQAMVGSSKDGSLRIVGSSLNKGMFALMAQKDFASSKELKGKRSRSARSATRRTTTPSRCSASTVWASATCSGFRWAPTSAAAPRRCRATVPTPRC